MYLASTGDGHVVELEFPSMNQIRSLDLFTAREHVNTLAVRSLSATLARAHVSLCRDNARSNAHLSEARLAV